MLVSLIQTAESAEIQQYENEQAANSQGPPTAIVAANGLLWQEALLSLIASVSAATIVGTASSLAELRLLIEQHQPRVVVVRIPMPGLEDAEQLLELREEQAQLALVVLWPRPRSGETLLPLITRGGLVALTSDSGAAEMCAALFLATTGWSAIAPVLVPSVFPRLYQNPVQARFPSNVLSGREIALLEGLACGRDERAVSVELKISPRTVQSRLVNIRQKLAATNRTHAVALALQAGLISGPD